MNGDDAEGNDILELLEMVDYVDTLCPRAAKVDVESLEYVKPGTKVNKISQLTYRPFSAGNSELGSEPMTP